MSPFHSGGEFKEQIIIISAVGQNLVPGLLRARPTGTWLYMSSLPGNHSGMRGTAPCSVGSPHITFDSAVGILHPGIQPTTGRKLYFSYCWESGAGNVKILVSSCSWLNQLMQNPEIRKAKCIYFEKKKICISVDPCSSNRVVQDATVFAWTSAAMLILKR